MNLPVTILTVVGTVGAVDVLYFHLYRFRLWEQPSAVVEEVTHLARHVIFLALLATLAGGVESAAVDRWVIALFVLDLINSAMDILYEPESRKPLGGLPGPESLIHVLSSFGLGVAAMSYAVAREQLPLAPAEGLLALQVQGMLVFGGMVFLAEAGMFLYALTQRGRSAEVQSAAR